MFVKCAASASFCSEYSTYIYSQLFVHYDWQFPPQNKHSHLRLILIFAAAAERDVLSGQRKSRWVKMCLKIDRFSKLASELDWNVQIGNSTLRCCKVKHDHCIMVHLNEMFARESKQARTYVLFVNAFFLVLMFKFTEMFFIVFLSCRYCCLFTCLFSFFCFPAPQLLFCSLIFLTNHNCHPILAYISKANSQTTMSSIA